MLVLLIGSLVACVDGCRVAPPGDDSSAETATPDTQDSSADDTAHQDTAQDDTAHDDTGPVEDHSCGTGTADGWQPPVHSVVVLVTDGARIDETLGDLSSTVTDEPTSDFWPDIRANLLSQGTEVLPAYATGVTITAEGHAAMLTGRRLPQANFPSDDGAGLFRPEVPTLFEALQKDRHLDEGQTALIVNTVHLSGHNWGVYPGYGESYGAALSFLTQDDGQPLGDDVGVIEEVQAHMAAADTNFVLANLHQIDRSGHYNASPQAYADNVKRVDAPITDFWSWIQSTEPYKDDTVLVVVADHGRHRWGEPEDFRNHGDQCMGCRQIPMFLIGPGVRKGATVTVPITLEDMGTTLAWLLGEDMPLATGHIACELLDNPPADRGHSGEVDVDASGGLVVSQRWQPDADQRATVVEDADTTLSTEGALHAEAPRVLRTASKDYACWRELTITPQPFDTIGYWSWTPRCLSRQAGDTSWTDIGFPVDAVSPYFRPDLAEDSGGRLWVTFADNQNGNWESAFQDMRLLRQKDATTWEGGDDGFTDVALPLHPSLALLGDTAYVAFTNSADPSVPTAKKQGRFTRHPDVFRVDWPAGGAQHWTRVFHIDTSFNADGDTAAPPASPWARIERPELLALDDTLQLAAVAYAEGGVSTIVWAAMDSDETWSDPQAVDDSGRVIGTVFPRWSDDGWLYWARLNDDDNVEVCRAAPTSPTPDCQDTGAGWIDGLAPTATGALVDLVDDHGVWTRTSLSW